MPPLRHDAIKQADDRLTAAGLPTYSELILALRSGAMLMPQDSPARAEWFEDVIDMLRDAGAV